MNSLMGEHRAQPPDAPALLHWYPTDAPPPGDVPEFILRYLLSSASRRQPRDAPRPAASPAVPGRRRAAQRRRSTVRSSKGKRSVRSNAR
jgi:hypothetical protein